MEKQKESWSRLPTELLSLILSRLVAGDCVSFRMVCKSWQSVPIDSIALQQSPHLMFINKRIVHPIYNRCEEVEIPDQPPGAVIRASNYGWLLIVHGHVGVYFFNPFTKMTIKLPDLYDASYQTMCFSSAPTSPDCLVVGFSVVDQGKVYISSIQRGEKSWTLIQLAGDEIEPFGCSVCNPIILGGKYYKVGVTGCLLIYDPIRNEYNWADVDCSPDLEEELEDWIHSQIFMTDSEGEILAVFVTCDHTRVRVCRLNLSQLIWEPVDNLGDRMLFVSRPACFIQTAYVKDTGNKIYFPRFYRDCILFYSLATGRFHSFANDKYSFEGFHGSTAPFHSTWIKPMIKTTPAVCHQDFSW